MATIRSQRYALAKQKARRTTEDDDEKEDNDDGEEEEDEKEEEEEEEDSDSDEEDELADASQVNALCMLLSTISSIWTQTTTTAGTVLYSTICDQRSRIHTL